MITLENKIEKMIEMSEFVFDESEIIIPVVNEVNRERLESIKRGSELIANELRKIKNTTNIDLLIKEVE